MKVTKQEIEAAADAMFAVGCAAMKWDTATTIPWRKSKMVKAWLALARWHCQQVKKQVAA